MPNQLLYHVTIPLDGSKVSGYAWAKDLEGLHQELLPGESMRVETRKRHMFVKVTAKYPTGAPSLRSFLDVCGMPGCGLPSGDLVHY